MFVGGRVGEKKEDAFFGIPKVKKSSTKPGVDKLRRRGTLLYATYRFSYVLIINEGSVVVYDYIGF